MAAAYSPSSLPATSKFSSYASSKLPSLELALKSALPIQEPAKLHEAMRYSVLGGRNEDHTHSLACIAACELVGGKQDMAMACACSLEILSAACQMHGELPFLRKLARSTGKATVHDDFGGLDMTLWSGVALFSSSFQLVAESSLDSARATKIMLELGEYGRQALDIEFRAGTEGLERPAVLMAASVVCGAIAGGASDDELEVLRSFGVQLGQLYQAAFPKGARDREELEEMATKCKQELIGTFGSKPSPLLELVDFYVLHD